MTKPVLLDLFCGAGGAGMGYREAGFYVVGVDISHQPSHWKDFICADVMTVNLSGLIRATRAVAVHASPPCQRYSRLARYQPNIIEAKYPDLIAPTRELLEATGLPYVIENVPGAPLIDPIELCGCMFRDLMIYRPRLFEINFGGVWVPGHEPHAELCVRNGYLPTPERPRMTITGGRHSRAWQRKACEAMGVPWMAVPSDARGERIKRGVREVCESIPPLYTRHIGSQLLGQVSEAA